MCDGFPVVTVTVLILRNNMYWNFVIAISKFHSFVVPDNFVVVLLGRTTDLITIAIWNTDNKMLSYTIYVNQTLYRTVLYASKVQNETISKLLPGMFYSIKIIGNMEQTISKVLQIGAATRKFISTLVAFGLVGLYVLL